MGMDNGTNTSENNWQFFYIVRLNLTIQSSNPIPRYWFTTNGKLCSHKNLYVSVLASSWLFIIAKDGKKSKYPSSGEWINKSVLATQWNATQQYKGAECWCIQMNDPQIPNGTWNRPDSKDYALSDFTYMTSFWKRQNYEDRQHLSGFQDRGWEGGFLPRGVRELGVMAVFCILIVAVVTWLYASCIRSQIVHYKGWILLW